MKAQTELNTGFSPKLQRLVEKESEEKRLRNKAAELGIPEEKYKNMLEYAKLLHRKHPNMNPSRIQRKVAEKFKIQLT